MTCEFKKKRTPRLDSQYCKYSTQNLPYGAFSFVKGLRVAPKLNRKPPRPVHQYIWDE